jgi:hypothetical protein
MTNDLFDAGSQKTDLLESKLYKIVKTVPQALTALRNLERDLTEAKTYQDVQVVIKEATAWKVVFDQVEEVKRAAENTILAACIQIGEEIKRIPKAGGPGRGKKKIFQIDKSFGRGNLGIPGPSRARLIKLADTGRLRVWDVPTRSARRARMRRHARSLPS